jgi:hypothetical protein
MDIKLWLMTRDIVETSLSTSCRSLGFAERKATTVPNVFFQSMSVGYVFKKGSAAFFSRLKEPSVRGWSGF